MDYEIERRKISNEYNKVGKDDEEHKKAKRNEVRN